MWVILSNIDPKLDTSLWKFIANKPEDIPQQPNGIDCSVFICLYARCLVTGTPTCSANRLIPQHSDKIWFWSSTTRLYSLHQPAPFRKINTMQLTMSICIILVEHWIFLMAVPSYHSNSFIKLEQRGLIGQLEMTLIMSTLHVFYMAHLHWWGMVHLKCCTRMNLKLFSNLFETEWPDHIYTCMILI